MEYYSLDKPLTLVVRCLKQLGERKVMESVRLVKDEDGTTSIQCWDNGKGRYVRAGILDRDAYHRHPVHGSHYMRKEKGFGIQQVILDYLASQGVERIYIHTKDAIYSSSLFDWQNRTNGPLDYGHGLQRFLARKLMTKTTAQLAF